VETGFSDVVFSELTTPLQELAEGPVWHGGSFYWCNITEGEVWKWTPDPDFQSTATGFKALPELITKASSMVGAFCFDRDDRLVLMTEKGLELYTGDGTSEIILPVLFRKGGRFNDCILDSAGRILGGTYYPEHKGGELISFSPDGEGGFCKGEVLLSGLTISNGMAFSQDGRLLYHTDTAKGTITGYTYSGEDGVLGEVVNVVKVDPDAGGPDGMMMDDKGLLWTALWGGSGLLILSADGKVEGKIECPAMQPTSIAASPEFNGKNMIMVTTSAYGTVDKSTGLSSEGKFLGGKIYAALI